MALGSINLPFSCDFGGSNWTPGEFAIGLKANVAALGLDGEPGGAVDRYFYQVCRVNPDGGNSCSQANEDAESDSAGNFKVLAQ